jgi:DNA repair protein RadC
MDDEFRPSTAVREMPEEERPRERLARVGAAVLRDAELLAILFRTGTRNEGAVALAERVLRHFRGDGETTAIRRLARASLEELQQVPGVGAVKAIEIKAALELGKRLAGHQDIGRVKIRSAQDVADLLMLSFKEYEVEHFKALLLNRKNEVVKVVEVSRGTVDASPAGARDVFRQAVREAATGIIVAHNHPSGDPEPSRPDVELTLQLAEAGSLLGIPLMDHVIFGDGRFVSMKERRLF